MSVGITPFVVDIYRPTPGHSVDLPPELILEIFVFAAQSSKQAACTISLVSWSARIAALPYLFQTLVLGRRKAVHGLHHFLFMHPHVAHMVRNIWMRESTSVDYILMVTCTNFTRAAVLPGCLATFCLYGDENEFPSLRRPQELVLLPGFCDWTDFDTSRPFTFSYFSGITRLWLTQPGQLLALVQCEPVMTALTGLTHLAVAWNGSTTLITLLFHDLASLELLVLTVLDRARLFDIEGELLVDLVEEAWQCDRRAVVVPLCGEEVECAVLPMWRESCLGRDSIWDKAATFSKKRSMTAQGNSTTQFERAVTEYLNHRQVSNEIVI